MLGRERPGANDQPVARQGRDLVDPQDRDRRPGKLELDGLVVHEARGGSHGSLGHGRPLAEVGVFDDLEVVGLEVRGPQQRLEHDPRRAEATRDPELLALEISGRGDPRRRLREDDRGELAVDRRDVADRDSLAGGRDGARAVRQADIDRTLPDEGDQVRVDLVLERDRQAGVGVIAGLVGQIERGELDARDEAQADGQGDRRMARPAGGRGYRGRARGRCRRRRGRRAARAAGRHEQAEAGEGGNCETGSGQHGDLHGNQAYRAPTRRRSITTTAR